MFFFLIILSVFLVLPVFHVTAQDNDTMVSTSFDMTDFPLWAKDLRRGEIVAFGSFPFTLLTTTFIMDSIRWNAEAGMDWSEAGRRYAPWPLKSAGAIDMSNSERELTFIAAASLSATIALADFIIVQIKRSKERRRSENLPTGTAITVRTPYPESGQDEGAANAITPDASNPPLP